MPHNEELELETDAFPLLREWANEWAILGWQPLLTSQAPAVFRRNPLPPPHPGHLTLPMSLASLFQPPPPHPSSFSIPVESQMRGAPSLAFFFFLTELTACRNSGARDGAHAAAVTTLNSKPLMPPGNPKRSPSFALVLPLGHFFKQELGLKKGQSWQFQSPSCTLSSLWAEVRIHLFLDLYFLWSKVHREWKPSN